MNDLPDYRLEEILARWKGAAPAVAWAEKQIPKDAELRDAVDGCGDIPSMLKILRGALETARSILELAGDPPETLDKVQAVIDATEQPEFTDYIQGRLDR